MWETIGNNELENINGGGVVAIIGVVIAGYCLIRSVVKEQGYNDGYNDAHSSGTHGGGGHSGSRSDNPIAYC